MISRWWNDLSVSKKLYGVVGLMAILIVSELCTLFFAISTLSAVRSFVAGEGMWSKAQKNSIYFLHRYARTHDEKSYDIFLQQLEVPTGDHQARMELEKGGNYDENIVVGGLLRGGNDLKDIPKMIQLVRSFYMVPTFNKAIDAWKEGDELISDYIDFAHEVRSEINSPKPDQAKIESLMEEVRGLDANLTEIESRFASSVGDASRWLENMLMWLLISISITIEGTSLFITFKFGKSLTKTLKEITKAAISVGKGDFSTRIPVRSKDELGVLAESLNTMAQNLHKKTDEKESAENASQVKNLFLANMSHEIRTPLNAILGFSSILTDPDLSQEDKEKYAAIIKRTGNTLNAIINDVLDLSKVEAEQIEIDPTTFSLTQLISDLKSSMLLRSDDKNIELVFNQVGQISELVFSDPVRLRQILSNLVGNAIKFTSVGSVTMTYQVKDELLYFEISDTGPGITPEQLSQLFKPFSQGDNSVKKKYGGTGLGLFISQRFARLMGGDVGFIESPKGSTFFASINYQPVVDDQRTPKQVEDLVSKPDIFKDKKILVVEDAQDNQTIVKVYLKKTGAILEFANNGQEALDLVSKNSYDFILMDIQMPVMDGYTAMKAIREMGIKTPIIAQTGYAMKEDQEKCLRLGSNGYISKPFDKYSLIKIISRFI